MLDDDGDEMETVARWCSDDGDEERVVVSAVASGGLTMEDGDDGSGGDDWNLAGKLAGGGRRPEKVREKRGLDDDGEGGDEIKTVVRWCSDDGDEERVVVSVVAWRLSHDGGDGVVVA
uniref:Uncharacterized protein n=1 Tax=Tanacetum cinerariifolium TaxID=118510 RepID=A0A699HE89_TANCI|nr:hypothetical protein [Tanacetum cinerariifolium]